MRNRTIVLGVMIAMGGLFFPVDRAGAAVLCTTKRGTVVVRPTACKKKEGALNLADFGAQGPAGASGPVGPIGTVDTSDFYTKDQADSQFLRGNGEVRSAHSDLLSGSETPLFVIPGVGELDVSCSGTSLMENHVIYRNLSNETQSWTQETVDQGNNPLLYGGEVVAGDTTAYASGAEVTGYSFHYRLTVYPPAGSSGTSVTYEVTGTIFPSGVPRCLTHGVAIITP